jgi:hypothetical protein
MSAITRTFLRNLVTNVSTVALWLGALMWATSAQKPQVWADGRFTNLGAVTVVPAALLALFAVLYVIAPHLEALFGEADQ